MTDPRVLQVHCAKTSSSKLAVFIFLQEHECVHVHPQKHRQSDTAEVRKEVRGEGPSDASRWSDGGREGGRRGEEKLEIRTTRPNAYRLFLRRRFHFTPRLLQLTHLMLHSGVWGMLQEYCRT